MTTGITGGCRCGAVRYTLALDAVPPTYACHCHDCQTWSGSAFSQQALLPEEGITVTGPLIVYEREGTGGRISRQRVCSICHTRLYNTNTVRPGLAVVRAGTLDDSHLLDVAAHIWTKRKQAWITIPEGVPAWPEGAPPMELAAALGLLP
jgi:hypothetical protein